MMSSSKDIIEFSDFLKLDIRVGTIISAEDNVKARKPAFILKVDFGDKLGIKTSSAQITDNYELSYLIGKQIMAVVNFQPMRVAGVKSEVLVLAVVCETNGTVLIQPGLLVQNGQKIA